MDHRVRQRTQQCRGTCFKLLADSTFSADARTEEADRSPMRRITPTDVIMFHSTSQGAGSLHHFPVNFNAPLRLRWAPFTGTQRSCNTEGDIPAVEIRRRIAHRSVPYCPLSTVIHYSQKVILLQV